MKITEKMRLLKAELDMLPNRQRFLDMKVFPFIDLDVDPFDAREACEFFGVEVNDLQAWKWLSQMPEGHINKIRRRVEDHLRKSAPIQIIKVADLLGVKTEL